ncbi:MAG: methionine--tRNA ligase [Bacillota bacterium]
MSTKTFYITTPIYYPSDRLHIGHALTTTMADTLSRYKRMRGYDVWFLTGSDEHGQKIERKAKEQGMTPIEYVDGIVASFQNLWSRLFISNDDFIRTSEERHIKVVQDIFKTIYDKGDIYKSDYEGWYCTPCETFWTERQLDEGMCPNPDCRRPVELVKEESYFFKISKYADRLLKHIEDNPDFIQPVARRNEMVSFIKSGLEDLCVSRTTFDWGIPVPIDAKHVIYVWFDALTNYISALGYGSDDSKFEKYWPVAMHLVGKDIVRFHTVIWPIILMAAGIEPPKKVFGHGWLLVEGGKMSKSRGNVVDPLVLIDRYGADAIRYFLLREMPFGSDGYYSEDALILRTNNDLANDLGNLVSRTTAMIEKFAGGKVPTPGEDEPIDQELKELATSIPGEVDRCLDEFQFSAALTAIWKLVSRTNKYIEDTAPWSLAKDRANTSRLEAVLYNMAEALRIITVLCSPFMPVFPGKVWSQLGLEEAEHLHTWDSVLTWGKLPVGTKINKGQSIFPRIEVEEETREPEKTVQPVKSVPSPASTGQPGGTTITIEEFGRVDLRVVEVISARRVEKADRLLHLMVRIGTEERSVVAGIAQHYKPEDLVGKKVIMVANLQPATLRGISSQGMVLAAVAEDGLSLLALDRDLPSGTKVR